MEYNFQDYTKITKFITKQLELQNNTVFPSTKEVLYWENKGYMHQKFKEYNISEPHTELCKTFDEVDCLNWDYPFLLKEEHSSSSAGVHKVTCKEDIDKLIVTNVFKSNDYIIAQKLINMRRDLRVTLVGDKIVHHYWRINNSKDWKPTSTGRGSSVDFNFFPEQWSEFIIAEFKKFNIPTGAFDIAWENDDLNNMPLILEVSPTYQINPKITNQQQLESYGKFKKSSFIGKKGYVYQYIKQTHDIIEKVVRLNHNLP